MTDQNRLGPPQTDFGRPEKNEIGKTSSRHLAISLFTYMVYGFSHKIRMDEFSSKTVCVTPQNWKKLNRYSWFLMDEFSSKTACVTTRKMKISEKILDQFSMICQ